MPLHTAKWWEGSERHLNIPQMTVYFIPETAHTDGPQSRWERMGLVSTNLPLTSHSVQFSAIRLRQEKDTIKVKNNKEIMLLWQYYKNYKSKNQSGIRRWIQENSQLKHNSSIVSFFFSNMHIFLLQNKKYNVEIMQLILDPVRIYVFDEILYKESRVLLRTICIFITPRQNLS